MRTVCSIFFGLEQTPKREPLVQQFYVWQNWFELPHSSLYGIADSVYWTRTFLRGIVSFDLLVNAILRRCYAVYTVQHRRTHSSLNYQITNPVFWEQNCQFNNIIYSHILSGQNDDDETQKKRTSLAQMLAQFNVIFHSDMKITLSLGRLQPRKLCLLE